MRDSWTARRSNQSILKEISPEYSLEGLMLKVKLQYFGHLIGKDSDAGKDGRQEEKGTTEDEIVGWHELMTEVACRQFPPLPGESPMASLTTSLEEFGGFFLTLTTKTERGSFDFLHDIH